MSVDGELDDARAPRPLGERREHGVADAAFGIVILDRDDAPGRFGRACRSVSASIGLIEYRSITRAPMSSSASVSPP
jgi:hypothetical protein